MARLLLKASCLLGVGVRYIDYHQTSSNYIYIVGIQTIKPYYWIDDHPGSPSTIGPLLKSHEG